MPATSSASTAPQRHALAQATHGLNLDALAKDCGFLRRRPKKLQPLAFLQVCCLLALQTQVSLRAWACLWGLLTGQTLSKQGLAKRCQASAVVFLRRVLEALLPKLLRLPTHVPAGLRPFRRVIIQDSTALALPAKLAAFFPGPRNQSAQASASLKIQVGYDLLSQRCLFFWLSAFTYNDQKASSLILGLARRGDLIVRDLGYLVLGVLAQACRRGIYFLTRYRHGLCLLDPASGEPLDLLAQLQRHGGFDGLVLLGQKERLPVRLVALALPPLVAAERRRKALANRDRRLRPTKERLALLDWEIFLTNVPLAVWSRHEVAQTYRLRWNIEILFKAWKSHFRLGRFTHASANQVQLLVYGRLLWIALFQVAFLPPTAQLATYSVLKLAAFCQDYLLLPLLLLFDPTASPFDSAFLLRQIHYHCRPEKRRKTTPSLHNSTRRLS